jgi:predicted phosphodiesterase
VNGWRLLLDDVTTTRDGGGVAKLPPQVKPSFSPSGRPLLCLSDIHGDLWALESVLSAVKSLELCGIVVAGDHCVGGDQPFEVWTRLCSLGAHMACGPSDLALGALSAGLEPTPSSAAEEARLQACLRTQKALGDVVCRRLADLPSTLVVSLDDTSGVMVMHGSPVDDSRGLVDDDGLAFDVACVAEDVLVSGATHTPFARRVDRIDEGALAFVRGDTVDDEIVLAPPPQPLLVVNAGSVGMSPRHRNDGRRTAHAVLLAPCDDGRVHAWGQDVLVMQKARARSVG